PTSSFPPRPEVSAHFAARGMPGVPVETGFVLAARKAAVSPVLSGAQLMFRGDDGSAGRASVAVPTGVGPSVRYAIDEQEETDGAAPGPYLLKEKIAALHRPLFLSIAATTGVSLLVCALLRLRPRTRTMAVALLLAFVVASRIAMVALIDASSFGIEIRYVYPVAGLCTALLLV